jgi:SAM-dependent methyltransferase
MESILIKDKPRAIDRRAKDRIRAHYDRYAPRRAAYRARNSPYHQDLLRYYRFVIAPGSRVLEIGCGDGWLLRSLRPSRGAGVDISERMIDAARRDLSPAQREVIQFYQADIECCRFTETFDFVILSDVVGNLLDIQQALVNIRTACTRDTRVIVNYHNILWEPLLKWAEASDLKMPQPHHNWLTAQDMRAFLRLTDFELVTLEQRFCWPFKTPVLEPACNRWLCHLPALRRLCLTNVLVMQIRPEARVEEHSVSIVIPCRNEKGNIRAALERLPSFGSQQQLIFVDGHSTDGTLAEIESARADFPDRDILALSQSGAGKADAVRLGFARATGDMLMILDADLTVAPEDLPKFYRALATRKGDFINGSRMVYPMERQAMRYLNMLGNKVFSALFSWLLNQRLRDTLCGTKVLFAADYRRIEAGRDYFGDFDPFGDFDLLFGARKCSHKIIEVPIRYRERTYGSTNIRRFYHGFILFKMVIFAFRKFKF